MNSRILVLPSASQTSTGDSPSIVFLINVLYASRSFLFRRSTTLYNRRQAKILTTVTSLFTSSYVYNWPKYLPDKDLKFPPSFDGRIVMYPSPKEVRDYFAWRQTDSEAHWVFDARALLTDNQPKAHINNLYNTVFWALVLQGGESTTQAHATLKAGGGTTGTVLKLTSSFDRREQCRARSTKCCTHGSASITIAYLLDSVREVFSCVNRYALRYQ